jgi:hypothetical protein
MPEERYGLAAGLGCVPRTRRRDSERRYDAVVGRKLSCGIDLTCILSCHKHGTGYRCVQYMSPAVRIKR